MMKKSLLLAVCAITAMASCTKNEIAPDAAQQREIRFTSPVVAPTTKAKAGIIEKTYPTEESFNVYAWYCEGDFDSSTAKPYMDSVKVTYNSSIDDETDGSGAWEPATPYYWPKNGKLTFSAYSPSDASTDCTISCDAAKGLTFTDFTVKETVTDQYDLLYSERAYDKTSSLGTTNDTYDGVDIVFNHALSAIVVKAKTAGDYSGAIKIQDIKVSNVYSKGDFSENLTNGYESTQTPSWDNHAAPTTYTLYSVPQGGAGDDNEGNSTVSTAIKQFGTTAILLPQDLKHDENDIVTITVKYAIAYGNGEELPQKAEFELCDLTGTENGTEKTITEWEMGKRYIYNITIGLETIYFAPSVEDWVDVNINLPQD